tara:strand:- start:826 stop:1410 length:585 start_codon:yes stop_codon:yes gene_type:complete
MSNYKFKTTNIRGKQYVEVNERIKFFRQEKKYENWSILSEFTELDAEHAMCRACIVDDQGRTRAVGHAMEVRSASNINKTSYVENCETSAWGRALACLGIGIDTSIASANEVETAIEQQEEKPTPAKKKAPAKKAPAKKAAPKKEEAPVEDIMDKAVNYVKGSKDKRKAYDLIESKYGGQLTEQQLAGLFKFVR